MKKRLKKQIFSSRSSLMSQTKAQVTIFIIIAIMLVVIIGIFLLLRSGIIPSIGGGPEINPSSYIELCIEDQMRSNINLILSQGGFIDPKNYKLYKDIKSTYLCKNTGLYGSCINQHPMLISEVTDELNESIFLDIEQCFIDLEESLEKTNDEVKMGDALDTEIRLAPGKILLDINKEISITRKGGTSIIKEVNIVYPSSLYNLASVAVDIARSEADFCYFEHIGYMNLYPEYLIKVNKMSDYTKIYSIQNKKTQEEMNIAIRGCALS